MAGAGVVHLHAPVERGRAGGTFRITVRDGTVAEATGLDDSGRRVVADLPDAVPTIGELLAELEQARREDADTAEAEYAPDGHPVRISLDWEENAIDDEARYVITAYEPADGRRGSAGIEAPTGDLTGGGAAVLGAGRGRHER
ncbi:DUF6174 domain-containing protein [Streptomyces sp. NPDC057623]|uniref:DUF6174 domain-containing protein n=1 Tax=Streptomyces sp. NPDC057623 TaxID=3346187 RepID=UPI0036D1EF5C